MNYLLSLSQKYPELALAEAGSLLKSKTAKAMRHLALVSMETKEVEELQRGRLAFTKQIFQVVFKSSQKDIMKDMQRFAWQKIYKRDFSLRIHYLDRPLPYAQKDFAGIIWRAVKKPKVNLDSPSIAIHLFFAGEKVYVALQLPVLRQDFEYRKPHLLEGFMPITLDPRLARAMVNLTGAMKGEMILDPFCGIGGILIEARLAGLKAIGSDILKPILNRAKANLQQYKIVDCPLHQADARTILKKYDYIVSDLPFGKNTKNIEQGLYQEFLIHLKKILRKRAVLGFPDTVAVKKLVKKAKLNLINTFTIYIHKSMSKKIIVVEP